MKHEQLSLFAEAAPVEAPSMPDGFRHAPDLIDAAEETRLVAAFADLPFKEFEFHGFLRQAPRRLVRHPLRFQLWRA